MQPFDSGTVSSTMTMLVATHKAAEVPSDNFYAPIHVGHARNPIDLGYLVDDLGENISQKNNSYCELTAQYWAWKNLSSDFVGLSHYRRYFKGTQRGPNSKMILSEGDARTLLGRSELVLAKPRNYMIETIESHYVNSHFGEDLEVVRDALNAVAPETVSCHDSVLRGREMSLFNMFLMSRAELHHYSEWLFAVLEECEKHIDNGSRSIYEQRTFGYLSEILLNVWKEHRSSDLRISYLPVVNTEGEPKIRKGIAMVKRKLNRSQLAATGRGVE